MASGGGIRCVLFDIGGVLLKLGESQYRQEVARSLGYPEMPAAYERFVEGLQRGEVDEREAWRNTFGTDVDPHLFGDVWIKHFTPQAEMLALAAELRGRGIRTAIFSNTQASHVRFMRRMGFLEGFDPVCFSCEIGRRKPDVEAFRAVLDTLGLPPGAVLFIDDVPENVAGARAAGLNALLHRGDVDATRREVEALVETAATASDSTPS